MDVIAIHAERQPERAVGEHVIIDAFNCLGTLIASAAVRAAGGRPMVEEVRARVLMGAERRAWAFGVGELTAAGHPEPVAPPGGQAIYTAGTTGKPKSVRWTPASEVSCREALLRDSAGKLVKRLLREPYGVGRASRV